MKTNLHNRGFGIAAMLAVVTLLVVVIGGGTYAWQKSTGIVQKAASGQLSQDEQKESRNESVKEAGGAAATDSNTGSSNQAVIDAKLKSLSSDSTNVDNSLSDQPVDVMNE